MNRVLQLRERIIEDIFFNSIFFCLLFEMPEQINKMRDPSELEICLKDGNLFKIKEISNQYRQGLVFNMRNKIEKHPRGLHDGARMLSLDPNILLYIYSGYIMYMTVTYILQRAQRKRKSYSYRKGKIIERLLSHVSKEMLKSVQVHFFTLK